MVLLGRLSLFGQGAARLDEEVIAVTARWHPLFNTRKLRAYAAGRDAEAATLEQLEQAFGEQTGRQVPLATREQLQAAAPHDVGQLLQPLQERATEAGLTAAELLRARGQREAQAMTELLAAQRQRIQAEQLRRQSAQLEFEFSGDESRQVRADMLAWTRRLAAIEGALEREPRRIEDGFAVRLTRVEPLGLVYLWPQGG